MSDIEERPSKIRKINPSIPTETPLPDAPEISNFSPDTSRPTNNFETDADAATTDATPKDDDTTQLSKSQLKKRRKREAWDAGKEDRKAFRRQKEKDKKARKAAAKQELAAKIAAGEIAPLDPPPPPKHVRPQQVPVGLILDCDFNELMTEKELISLAAQLTRSYSENRSAGFRTHLAISSWGGKLKERFETVLGRNHESWKGVMFLEENFVDAGRVVDGVMRGERGGEILGALKGEDENAPNEEKSSDPKEEDNTEENTHEKDPSANGKAPLESEQRLHIRDATNTKEPSDLSQTDQVDQSADNNPVTETKQQPEHPPPPPSLVYLSSDSTHTLTELSPYTTYIIGGIVDKNRHKNLCHKRATSLGIPTAKLPIGDFMVMNSRSVLAVNHVVEIMLRWLECGDWGVAFENVIPKRKGGVLKSKIKAKEGKGEGEGGDGYGEEEYDDNDGYYDEEEQDADYYEVKKDQEHEGEHEHEREHEHGEVNEKAET